MQNIPTVTRSLLIANVVVFLATMLLSYVGLDLNIVLKIKLKIETNLQA